MMKIRFLLLIIAIGLLNATCQSSHKDEAHPPIAGTPLLWGFDDAGSGIRQVPASPVAKKIIEDFGFDLVVRHYHPTPSIHENIEAITALHDFYTELNMKWIINVETANFRASFIDEHGNDWYNHEDGRHFFLFPDEVLQAMSELENKPGIMYDEPEHMQNARNGATIGPQEHRFTDQGFDAPFFLSEKMVGTLEEASARFTEEAGKIARHHEAYGLQLYTEHVFPVMYHNFARAGFVPVSKILKESNSPAYIACALGAAIQYNKPFWLTPDLWNRSTYPGHSVDAYRSALLLAYHMGAEGIYTENMSHDQNRQQKGSLILMNEENDDYIVTEYGEIKKWFREMYIPENPRYYNYRELLPRVAIIRQEDASWGQSDSWLPDWLFGVKEWQSNPVTEAWLEIWHLLSRGEISPHGLSCHNRKVREKPFQLFYPLDGVVVFDEYAEKRHLQGVELIFLTGVGVSGETLEAVRSLVRNGAVCVSLPHLVPDKVLAETGSHGVLADGEGKWVVTESFLHETVQQHVEAFLPEDNYIRYRFGDREVEFRPIDGDNNRLSVNFVQVSP